MKLNFIRLNSEGTIIDRKIHGLVATSADADYILIFADFDVSTVESAYRVTARCKRNDGLIQGPLDCVLTQVTQEEADTIGVDYLGCRKLKMTKTLMKISGEMQITVSYHLVNENGIVIFTKAQPIFSVFVYNAVEELYSEEEYNNIKTEMLPRDLGDITVTEAADATTEILVRHAGATKKATIDKFFGPIGDKTIKDLGRYAPGALDSIITPGLYKFESTENINENVKGVVNGVLIVRSKKIDDETSCIEQLKIFGDLVQKRSFDDVTWSNWETVDLFEIKALTNELGLKQTSLEIRQSLVETKQLNVESSLDEFLNDETVKGTINTNIETKLNAKEVEYAPRLTEAEKLTIINKNYLNKSLIDSDSINFNSANAEEPIITFIDDDGRKEVFTRLFPIFQSRNLPFAIAIGQNNMNKTDFLTLEQVELLHQYGVDVINHLANNSPFNSTPIEQWEEEMKSCRDWLYKMGYEYDYVVYPNGESDSAMGYSISKKYAKCGFQFVHDNVVGNLKTYSIGRKPFGAFFTDELTHDLAYYKAIVDNAVANKHWLVFNTHIVAQDITQDTILGQLLDYIVSLNVRILNPSEAYKIRANKIEINGKTILNAKGEIVYEYKGINTILLTSPITDFQKGKSVYNIGTTHAINNGFPESTGGLFITYRYAEDDTLSYQEFKIYQKNLTYVRLWSGTSWTTFELKDKIVILTQSVNNDTPITSFKDKAITYTTLGNATMEVSGFPFTTASLLITNRIANASQDGASFQTLKQLNSNTIMKRNINASGVWSAWRADGIVVNNSSAIKNDTLISYFTLGAITYTVLSNTAMESAGFPIITSALIITNRVGITTGSGFQILKQLSSNVVLKRTENGSDGTWGMWQSDGIIKNDSSSIVNTTPLSYFTLGAITYTFKSDAGMAAAGFPITTSAMLITDRTMHYQPGFDRQILRSRSSNDEWTRGTDLSGNWLPFEKINKVSV